MKEHSDNPLAGPLHDQLLKEAIDEAKRVLVGRRILHVWGPLKSGMTHVKRVRFGRDELARVDLYGREDDPEPIFAPVERHHTVPIIYKDFLIHGREIDLARMEGFPLDPTVAIRAAHWVCDSEDDLIFQGKADSEVEGFMNASGRNSVPLNDWTRQGQAYTDVVNAIEVMLSQNHHGPYAMVMNPRLYHQLHYAHEGAVLLPIDQIRKLVDHGVYRTPVLSDDEAVIISVGKQNFDIAVTHDLDLTYLEPRGMNHAFRIHEMLALRIKRPEAVCTLERKRGPKARKKGLARKKASR